MFWDLKHHKNENLLISLSSNGNITFWETTTEEQYIIEFSQAQKNWVKGVKNKKTRDMNEENAIPTRCEFMKQNNNNLIIGFNDVTISLLDINKNSFISHYNLFNNNNIKKGNNINKILYQPNCIACFNTIPCSFIGFEDSTIKLLDFRNSVPSLLLNNIYNKKIISENIKAHDDAVTSLNLYQDIYLFSTSHDGKIKLWDVRKLEQEIDIINTGQKKWDESIWDSLLIEKNLTLCVGCSDSTIKLYQL